MGLLVECHDTVDSLQEGGNEEDDGGHEGDEQTRVPQIGMHEKGPPFIQRLPAVGLHLPPHVM